MRLSYVNNLVVPYHDSNSNAINHCVHVHASIGVVNSSRMPFITQENVSAGDIMIYDTLFVRRAAQTILRSNYVVCAMIVAVEKRRMI